MLQGISERVGALMVSRLSRGPIETVLERTGRLGQQEIERPRAVVGLIYYSDTVVVP